MPHYDYQCIKCKIVFDKFHSFKENKKYPCPVCDSKTKKLISGKIGANFNGSGFYENDYKVKT